MKKYLNNWYIKSILTGLISGLFSLILFPNFIFGVIVFIVVLVLMLINNPKRRFMKAFWVVFSAFVALNKFSLWIAGEILDVEFFFNTSALDWSVSIFLILLLALLLFLDYLERNDKEFDFLGVINIKPTKVKGNVIHVANGASITQIIVHGDYIESDGKKKEFSDFTEIKDFLKREEELQILIKNPEISVEQNTEYKKELEEIKFKTEQTKKEIVGISKTINILSSKYPEQANEMSQFLLNGFYGSAKDYFMEIQAANQDKKLAEKLGIEYDELLELDYWIEDGHTSNDGMIYYYNIWFSEDSPIEIIEKIEGVEKIDDSYCLEVPPWFFDEPEDYDHDYENN